MILGISQAGNQDFFIEEWLGNAQAHFSPSTYYHYASCIAPVLQIMSWPPAPQAIRQYIQDQIDSGKIKLISANTYRRGLRAAYQWAITNGYLHGDNSVDKVPRWRVENPASVEWFDVDEISSILDYLPHDYHPLVHFVLTCGLRLSECLNLKWDDLENGRMRIVCKGAKLAHLPISSRTRAVLNSIPKEDEYRDGPFPFKKGIVSQVFRRAQLKAGIHKGHFHALRDTFAVWLLEDGIDIYTVSKLLRHNSVTTTEKHYGHLSQDFLLAALESTRKPTNQPTLEVVSGQLRSA